MPCRYVSIIRGAGSLGVTVADRWPEGDYSRFPKETLRRYLAICFAGVQAEIELVGSIFTGAAYETDHAEALAVACELAADNRGAQDELNRAKWLARVLLERHRFSLRRVSRALLKRRRLSTGDIAAAMKPRRKLPAKEI